MSQLFASDGQSIGASYPSPIVSHSSWITKALHYLVFAASHPGLSFSPLPLICYITPTMLAFPFI